jgi:phosphoribosyl 1,2-cyclic phosphodiesterase
MAECNYSKEAVDHAVKKGYVPEIVRSRLLDTHMSIDHFSEMLEANDLKQLQQIYLLHLSDNNSNAEEFKERVQKKTGVEVYVC